MGKTIKNSRDVERLVERTGGWTENGKGSHRKAYDENGNFVCVYYETGEYPKGTRHAIEKALKVAGLLVLFVILPSLFGGYLALAVRGLPAVVLP